MNLKIHPFQDGNRRVVILKILKHCIESNIDIIEIDEKYNVDYKRVLGQSKISEDDEELENVFQLNYRN